MAEVYSLVKSIREFGDNGLSSAIKEMSQLHDRICWKPRTLESLTHEERQKALESMLFLTPKRDGTIKGRTVAIGSKQHAWTQKGDASSPTVGLASVFLTGVQEAKEQRIVTVVDIPNAFVITDHEGAPTVIMKIKGKVAEILIQLHPEVYKEYAVYENGVLTLYVEILKALYGLIEAPLLWYRRLRSDLLKDGFTINPYDPCVANKMVNGKQLTVTWHMDDLKVSHVEEKVVEDFIK